MLKITGPEALLSVLREKFVGSSGRRWNMSPADGVDVTVEAQPDRHQDPSSRPGSTISRPWANEARAMDEKHPEIIIIKRHSSHEEEHHGGAWKIAFADFMTAMMAFFLVLWIINATDKNTKTIIARYFNPLKLEDMAKAQKGHPADRGNEFPGSRRRPDAETAGDVEAE